MKIKPTYLISSILSKCALLSCTFIMVGCTYSINMVQTDGSAEDVVDETQTPSTSISATIPASAVAK